MTPKHENELVPIVNVPVVFHEQLVPRSLMTGNPFNALLVLRNELELNALR